MDRIGFNNPLFVNLIVTLPLPHHHPSRQGHSRVIVFNFIFFLLFLLIRRFLASASHFAHSDFRSYCLAF